MKPLISVVIPVYNHAHTLQQTFLSLKNQIYKPLEIIVVNDGSIDDFDEVMKRILTEYADFSIAVVSQSNQGAAAARNVGFQRATGEYVIFWDADTVALPTMLDRMQTALEQDPEAGYAYSSYKFGWKVMPGRIFDADKLRSVNYIDMTSLIRRSSLPAKPFDESLKRFQDWDLWLTLLEAGKRGIFIPLVLYKKIVHGRQGMSAWVPRFVYRLPWKTKRVKKYEAARTIIMSKHHL